MSVLAQHILVLTLVAACIAYVAFQAFRALRGRKSKIGSCCATGCRPPESPDPATRTRERIVFLPVESLTRRK